MLAQYIDHTILKPTTTHIEISKICEEAVEYGFAAVCVPPPFVAVARRELGGRAGVKVATVIGFPFGYSVAAAKEEEVRSALIDGADELDVVIHLIALKAGDRALLEAEMRPLTEKIHEAGKIVKVIIESGVLTDEEIIKCCEVYSRIGVDFLKTSTGYAEKGAGATEHAVRLMRAHLPAGVRIKASGGIRTAVLAQQLIDAGANRLGCSASVEIVRAEAAGVGGAAAEGY